MYRLLFSFGGLYWFRLRNCLYSYFFLWAPETKGLQVFGCNSIDLFIWLVDIVARHLQRYDKNGGVEAFLL